MIYLISDTHFGDKTLKRRPPDFEDRLMDGLNNLKPDDILIHLGDVCVEDDSKWNGFFRILPCKKILILGNWDKQPRGFYETFWDEVTDVYSYGNILFSHYPIEKHANHFIYNIHGHWHDCTPESMDYVNYDQENHMVLAPEYTNYQPIELSRFLTTPQPKFKPYTKFHRGLNKFKKYVRNISK